MGRPLEFFQALSAQLKLAAFGIMLSFCSFKAIPGCFSSSVACSCHSKAHLRLLHVKELITDEKLGLRA